MSPSSLESPTRVFCSCRKWLISLVRSAVTRRKGQSTHSRNYFIFIKDYLCKLEVDDTQLLELDPGSTHFIEICDLNQCLLTWLMVAWMIFFILGGHDMLEEYPYTRTPPRDVSKLRITHSTSSNSLASVEQPCKMSCQIHSKYSPYVVQTKDNVLVIFGDNAYYMYLIMTRSKNGVLPAEKMDDFFMKWGEFVDPYTGHVSPMKQTPKVVWRRVIDSHFILKIKYICSLDVLTPAGHPWFSSSTYIFNNGIWRQI